MSDHEITLSDEEMAYEMYEALTDPHDEAELLDMAAEGQPIGDVWHARRRELDELRPLLGFGNREPSGQPASDLEAGSVIDKEVRAYLDGRRAAVTEARRTAVHKNSELAADGALHELDRLEGWLNLRRDRESLDELLREAEAGPFVAEAER